MDVGPRRQACVANQQELARLTAAHGAATERLYQQLMVPRRQGRVAMIAAGAFKTSDDEVRHLAKAFVNPQTAELRVVREILAACGAPVQAP